MFRSPIEGSLVSPRRATGVARRLEKKESGRASAGQGAQRRGGQMAQYAVLRIDKKHTIQEVAALGHHNPLPPTAGGGVLSDSVANLNGRGWAADAAGDARWNWT